MSLLDTLVEMGFAHDKAEKALGSTGGNNLEDAINWIISHPDGEGGETKDEQSSVEITMDEQQQAEQPAPDTQPKEQVVKPKEEAKPVEEAKSIKCDECGKQFRTQDEVEFHAAKSGHMKFSESADAMKPLTEEEKRARMLALQERLKQKRLEKEADEKKNAVESEKHRRMTGQQILAAKQRVEEEEMKKIADERKRQKKEDALTKQRILEEIKRDREAKKLQQAGGSSDAPIVAAAPPPPPTASPTNQAAESKKSYDQCQLQIRLPDGKVLKQAFCAKEQLSAVRLYVQLNAPEIIEPFTFMTNFPKRVFSDADMEAPLVELDLVPTAVLILTRKPL